MTWIPVSLQCPAGPAIIYGGGEYHVAELIGDVADGDAAFMDLHSCEPLPWPTHWMQLAEPPPAD